MYNSTSGVLDDNIPPKTSKRKVAELFERTNPKTYVIFYVLYTYSIAASALYPYIQRFGFLLFYDKIRLGCWWAFKL
jgi:hypothetical protein